jgi:hypothetical protein
MFASLRNRRSTLLLTALFLVAAATEHQTRAKARDYVQAETLKLTRSRGL